MLFNANNKGERCDLFRKTFLLMEPVLKFLIAASRETFKGTLMEI